MASAEEAPPQYVPSGSPTPNPNAGQTVTVIHAVPIQQQQVQQGLVIPLPQKTPEQIAQQKKERQEKRKKTIRNRRIEIGTIGGIFILVIILELIFAKVGMDTGEWAPFLIVLCISIFLCAIVKLVLHRCLEYGCACYCCFHMSEDFRRA